MVARVESITTTTKQQDNKQNNENSYHFDLL